MGSQDRFTLLREDKVHKSLGLRRQLVLAKHEGGGNSSG